MIWRLSSSSNIVAGCDATEILLLCAFADSDGNVVCPYPSYGQFASDANVLGASVRYYPLDENYKVDPDDMASRVDSNMSAICITNPNNTTATVLAAVDIENFVNNLPSHVVVIPGNYAFDWNGINLSGAPVASGSYFYRLTVGDFSQARRMILVK